MEAAQDAENQRRRWHHVVALPCSTRLLDEEVLAYFNAVASGISIPILIYNNPVDYKIEVTSDMLRSCCSKRTTLRQSKKDLGFVQYYPDAEPICDDLKSFVEWDTLALESFLMGANGWVAGLVCAFPKETVAIYRLVKAGQLQEAREIYRWFMPILN